jgi:hypothetical protein
MTCKQLEFCSGSARQPLPHFGYCAGLDACQLQASGSPVLPRQCGLPPRTRHEIQSAPVPMALSRWQSVDSQFQTAASGGAADVTSRGLTPQSARGIRSRMKTLESDSFCRGARNLSRQGREGGSPLFPKLPAARRTLQNAARLTCPDALDREGGLDICWGRVSFITPPACAWGRSTHDWHPIILGRVF